MEALHDYLKSLFKTTCLKAPTSRERKWHLRYPDNSPTYIMCVDYYTTFIINFQVKSVRRVRRF